MQEKMTGQEIEENTLVNRWVGEYLKEKKKREQLEQECEELERKLSNQEQLYQNEIEIYNKSCLQLRQENDDLYLERLALNTANSGINALLEVKEQECDRYRKALKEIEECVVSSKEQCIIQDNCVDDRLCSSCFLGGANELGEYILDIINKVKGEGK